MIGQKIETLIEKRIRYLLNKDINVDLPEDLIETDTIGEVIEKISILHCRMWYLEDRISDATNDKEIADLKRKIDICFKIKRPRLVEAINRMIDSAIITGRKLEEASVKNYNGFNEHTNNRK